MQPASITPATANLTVPSTDTSSTTSTTTAAPQVRARSSPDNAATSQLVTISLPNRFLQTVANGDTAQAINLIQQGAPVNHTDTAGSTALAIAAKNGDIDMMTALLAAGANVDGSPKNPVQWLTGGVSMGRGAWAACTLTAWTSITVVAACSGFGIVGLLAGAPALYAAEKVAAKWPDCSTPLIMAAQHGQTKAVELLLEKGALIDFTNARRRTALGKAAEHGCIGALTMLIQHGAQVNFTGYGDQTALMYAAQNGHEAVVQELFKNGAKINAANTIGRTALILAAERGHTDTINLLIALGADVDQAATYGGSYDGTESSTRAGTALIFAAKNGYTKTVEALIAAKARVTSIADYNLGPRGCGIAYGTALLFAATKGYHETLEVLLQQKTTAEERANALKMAETYNHPEAVAVLRAAIARLEG
jgi:ankyrin repeat protein